MKWLRLLCVPLLVVSVGGCAALQSARCAPGETAALQDTIYFGTGKPQGGEVSADEWAAFLANEVTPRFPSGLTVLDADGQWLGANGAIVQERSFVLQLVHSADTASSASVSQITASYKQQFGQEAVLRVRSRICMAL